MPNTIGSTQSIPLSLVTQTGSVTPEENVTPVMTDSAPDPVPVRQSSNHPGIMEFHANLASMHPEIQEIIAGYLDDGSLKSLRKASKQMKAVATREIKHLRLTAANLARAIETFKVGGIKSITLEGTVTPDDLLLLRDRLPSLQELNLSGSGIADAHLEHLRGVKLQRLNLSRCYGITGVGLAPLHHMPLQQLDLSRCDRISSLAYLRGMKLQRLNLSNCRRITDDDLAHLKGMPLRQLGLSYCYEIGDAGLKYLESTPLQHLDLSGNSRITPATVAFWRNRLGNGLEATA
jgi:uncharacterized protein YjbI with pentapeptide repeats